VGTHVDRTVGDVLDFIAAAARAAKRPISASASALSKPG